MTKEKHVYEWGYLDKKHGHATCYRGTSFGVVYYCVPTKAHWLGNQNGEHYSLLNTLLTLATVTGIAVGGVSLAIVNGVPSSPVSVSQEQLEERKRVAESPPVFKLEKYE